MQTTSLNTPPRGAKLLLVLFYPWVVWAISSSFMLYKNILSVAPAVMNDDLMRAFGIAGFATGNLVAFWFYSYSCMQIPVGIILDRFGTRHIVTCAILLCAGGAYLFGQAESLHTAQLGRFLMGIGAAFSAVGALKLITIWFKPERFALVSGLMMTLAMIGLLLGKTPVAWSVMNFGWRATMTYTAILGVGFALVFWLIIRDKAVEPSATFVPKLPFWNSMGHIVRNPQSWLISIYSGIVYSPLDAFAGAWGDSFLVKAYGIDKLTASNTISWIFIGFAIGAPLAGWFSDYIKRRRIVMLSCTFLSLLCILPVIYLTSMPSSVLQYLFFGFGFFTGGYFISFAVMREINDPRVSGTAIGFTNTFNAMLSAASIVLIGYILDKTSGGTIVDNLPVFSTQNFQTALATLIGGLVIAMVMLFAIRETRCEQQDI
jgi:sugar phosphate permease